MSADTNKETMLRYYKDVWQSGDSDAEKELVAESFVDHNPLPGQPGGIEGHHYVVSLIRSAFPDARFEIDHMVAEGDLVTGHWTMSATHLGEIMGVLPTGKSVRMSGMDLGRWQEGKLQEIWHIEDMAGLCQQLGVMGSAPAGAPATA